MVQQLEVEVSKEAATEAVNFPNFLKWCKAESDSGKKFMETADSNNRMASGVNAGAAAKLEQAEKTVARLAPTIAAKDGELRAAEQVRASARGGEKLERDTLMKTIRAVDLAERYAKKGKRKKALFLQNAEKEEKEEQEEDEAQTQSAASNISDILTTKNTTSATMLLHEEYQNSSAQRGDQDEDDDDDDDDNDDDDSDNDESDATVSFLQQKEVSKEEGAPSAAVAVKTFDSVGDTIKKQYAQLAAGHAKNEAAWKKLEGAMKSELKSLTKEMNIAKA